MKFKLLSDTSEYLRANWRPLALYSTLLIVYGWVLWWQLGSLTAGFSANEQNAIQSSTNLKAIFEHPLNAPFKLAANAVQMAGDYGLLAGRIVAIIIGLASLTVFYWLVRYWHGEKSALLGTIIFGSSAWFLHVARYGTPGVLLLLLIALVACAVWLKRTNGSWPLLLSFILAAALMYVPGMIWFIGLGVIWQWKRIDQIFKKQLWVVSLGALLLLAALAPLGLAIYHDPTLAKQIAGLPAEGWPNALQALHNLANVGLQLFFRGPQNPAEWLGQLPILSAFSLAMFGLGVYVYTRHLGLGRSKLLAVILVMGSVLGSLEGDVTITIIIPFIYILVAVGIGFMLSAWYEVFPRNVIAQSVGVSIVSIAVLISCWYNVRHYFIAWPAAPPTKQIFTVSQG